MSFSPRSAIKRVQAHLLRRWPNLSFVALPIIVIVVTFLGSIAAYSLSNANLEVTRSRTIDRTLRDNQAKFRSSLESYSQLLMSGVGRINSGSIDEQAWQKFMAVYDLRVNFPSMEAVGLAYKDESSRVVVSYVSPDTEMTKQFIRFDLITVPQLQRALEQAARQGATTVSESLPQVGSTKTGFAKPAPGFVMLAPFYDQNLALDTPEEKQSAVRGYTSAMFRGDIFFSQLFKDSDLSHTKLAIYIGNKTSANHLYEIGTNTDGDRTRQVQQEVIVHGQKFTFVYSFDTASILSFSQTYLPQALLFGGLSLGSLFALIGGYLLRNRYRRLTYEKERDVEFAKDELLSLASHQLRTPATGVKQYLGMVLQGFVGDITEKQRDYLTKAYASNDRQLHIINDILHLAKIDAGRIILAKREFDLADMIREVVDEQHDEASKNDIELIQQTPDTALIVGDSHMLRMVVENLVSNAVKYTPTKGRVDVYLARRGTRWVITVKDTGVGIAKADFAKLFQQFSRINNPQSDYVTGTGVGLYLAHHLTILHGGTISVSSSVGKGSTFTVRLPRKL